MTRAEDILLQIQTSHNILLLQEKKMSGRERIISEPPRRTATSLSPQSLPMTPHRNTRNNSPMVMLQTLGRTSKIHTVLSQDSIDKMIEVVIPRNI